MKKDRKYIKMTKHPWIPVISSITLYNEAVWNLVDEFSWGPSKPKRQWCFLPFGCSKPFTKSQMPIFYKKELWLASKSQDFAFWINIQSYWLITFIKCITQHVLLKWGAMVPTHSFTGHWLITTIRLTFTCDKAIQKGLNFCLMKAGSLWPKRLQCSRNACGCISSAICLTPSLLISMQSNIFQY